MQNQRIMILVFIRLDQFFGWHLVKTFRYVKALEIDADSMEYFKKLHKLLC